ncbi:hypothetical protein N7501_002601 [Penicillium viridicatum]|nr:hypothetical protein N7501_002601 [Penicillium viridicatum]
MSPTIAHGIYNARSNAEWKPTPPSATPAGEAVLHNANKGTTREQQAWQTTQAGNILQNKQAPSNFRDDGQYHPNRPPSSGNNIMSGRQASQGGNALDATSKGTPTQQSSPYQQTSPDTQDDGQYNPNQHSSPDKHDLYNTYDYSVKGMPLTSSSNGLYNPGQLAEAYPPINQEFPPSQHGPSTNAHSNQELGGRCYGVTYRHPATRTTHYQPGGNIQCFFNAHILSNEFKSASSPAARAGIVLSVIGAVGLIAVLILLPLHKRRKRLRRILGPDHKKVAEDEPLPMGIRPLDGFITKIYNRSARMVCFTKGFLRRTRQTSDHAEYFDDSQTVNGATKTIISQKPPTDNYPAPYYTSPTSGASWEIERPQPCLNNFVAHSKQQTSEQTPEQTGNPNLGHLYGLGSLENLSVGNLIAAKQPVDNIYTVEIDYSSRRADQLELRVGQRLCILQAFDNGWAMGVRLDRPEAGLVPRSHISANSEPLQRESRKSKKYPSPQQPLNSLTSRFYSLFSEPVQQPHPTSIV